MPRLPWWVWPLRTQAVALGPAENPGHPDMTVTTHNMGEATVPPGHRAQADIRDTPDTRGIRG